MRIIFQPWPILTLAMMSCLRMNTPESYIKATNIYNNLCDSKTRTKSEIAYPYILLTAKQNNLEEAFEILKHKVDKDTKKFRELGTHAELQISLYIQMERLPDAIEVLENIVKLATIGIFLIILLSTTTIPIINIFPFLL